MACGSIAYGQAAWSCPPDAGDKPRVESPGRWWPKSPVHQRERGAAVNPLRRECRTCSALPVILWAPFRSAHEPCGCGQRPAFPAPSGTFRGTTTGITRAIQAAGLRGRVLFCRPGQASPLRRTSAVKSRARSGTHNHRTMLLYEIETPSLSYNNRLWLWVPAFAGTTPGGCLTIEPEDPLTHRGAPSAPRRKLRTARG